MHNLILLIMAINMKSKDKKYWGKIDNMNYFPFISNVLGLIYKLIYAKKQWYRYRYCIEYDMICGYFKILKIKDMGKAKYYIWILKLYHI